MKTEGPYLEKFSYVYKIQNLKEMFMKMLILDILIKDIRNSNKGYNTNDL